MNYLFRDRVFCCDDIRSLHHDLISNVSLTNDFRKLWWLFSGTMIDENYAMYRFTTWIRFGWCKWFTDEQMDVRIINVHKHPQSLMRTLQKQHKLPHATSKPQPWKTSNKWLWWLSGNVLLLTREICIAFSVAAQRKCQRGRN